MDFKKITDEIMENIGGEENVNTLSHCMTRLRFVLKDESKVNLEVLKSINGVLGATFGAGQLQVIMGQNLFNAFDMIMKNYHFSGDGSEGSSSIKEKQPKSVKTIATDVVNFVSGSVSGVITGLVAGGMLKLLLFLAVLGMPDLSKTQTYAIMSFIADVPFYFMPIFVAYGASKKLGCAPIYAMLVACALLHPNFTAMVKEGGTINMFGLPVALLSYSSSMIPALLSTISVYYLEKFFNKIVPGIFKTVFVGALTVLCASVLTFVVFGPIGTYIGIYVVGSLIWLQGAIGPVALGVLTALLPFMVMMGMHTLLATFLVQSLTVAGYDSFFRPALILHVIAEGGAAIGVGLRTKNKALRSEALSIGFGSVVAGISEPAIYGIVLRYKKPLYGVMAGGAAGGIAAGIFGVKAYMMSKTTILAVPIFKETMGGMMIACGVAFAVSCVVAYIVGIDEEKEKPEDKNMILTDSYETEVVSVVDGTSFQLTEVKDEVFSRKTMGDGIAFTAKGNVVVAPCSGELTMVFPSGHAFAITRDDGVQVMIHIGIDTVSLNGRGFDVKVEQGKHIHAGEELVSIDLDYLKTTGLDLSIMVIFLDTNGKEIKFMEYGNVVQGKTTVVEVK